MTLIVGLGHKARHGKDTVAQMIHAEMPQKTKIMSFADDLKALARALGMCGKNGPFLQQLGVAMRTLNEGYWVLALQERINEVKPDVVLVPDMRFPNEWQWIKDSDGITVRVTRVNPDETPWYATDRPATHISETALDNFKFDLDFRVKSGDYDGLRQAANRTIAAIKEQL